jgi:hypothetical protein
MLFYIILKKKIQKNADIIKFLIKSTQSQTLDQIQLLRFNKSNSNKLKNVLVPIN